ncbi:flagellar type III secretion system protein FlhB [Buchnera aphidicola (Aphis craccivore)]|uniref:Flagellar biosynthetic protein FlhB n=1 Tax=Buchnera aphidicola (Aphis craccivora) TaxID=466616 RepID=A0AA95E581_9GAMM|nr:flagellar biosynthesis protein FlhB [Buchnera aphidicola]QLL40630.1 flagellar type III secretion system protein FlhB [Buchnera aphidicola (Aphis craccivore)]WAI18004.1 MAG: flagellar biosynthesis protein FlhB [Buchnera aphidicola (Aphis craccivora)]
MNHDTHEEKTEQPTEHHIKKSRKKGKTRYSRELNSLLILIVGLLNLWWFGDLLVLEFSKILSNSFHFNNSIIINEQNILLNILISLKKIFIVFTPFLCSLLFIIIVPAIFFSGVKFNLKSLKFNLKKLNLIDGLKRVFSLKIFFECFKNMLKLLLIGSIVLWYLSLHFFEILFFNIKDIFSAFSYGFNTIIFCCILVIIGLIPIVVFDIFWQQFQYYKKLKMTHQQIKDEFKEQEGHPHLKIRIRRQMKENFRRRMILNVPKSDVVITNPIHYSVALRYDEKKMNAPKVIAKGIGDMAVQIQNIASKNNIPIISAPALARSLYRYSEIGQYIPGPLYKAVAEILAWVWKVRKWKKEGGKFPEKPKNIFVPSELNFTGESKRNV